jgi:hypothetical protein
MDANRLPELNVKTGSIDDPKRLKTPLDFRGPMELSTSVMRAEGDAAFLCNATGSNNFSTPAATGTQKPRPRRHRPVAGKPARRKVN